MARSRKTAAAAGPPQPAGFIRVRGARVHNLRGVDLDIPRDRLVVLTGVSGSGKSSLAFDTLYAEGQRRYIESLSVYARQFLDPLERPDVDLIEGLPPTVAVQQQLGAASPRSTVGTITECYDFLRLLYARAGTPHCPRCQAPIQRQSPEQIVETALGLPPGCKVLVLAPLARAKKGAHADTFATIRRAGLLRARIDGQVLEVHGPDPALARMVPHDIEAVVDRLVVREGIRPRLSESIDAALKLGGGTVLLSVLQDDGTWTDRVLSIHLACPGCELGLRALEPRVFSFNSPQGACPECEGLGRRMIFDPDLILPAPGKPIHPDTLPFWRVFRARQGDALKAALKDFFKRHNLASRVPRGRWSETALHDLLQGDGVFAGLIPTLEALLASARSDAQRAELDAFRGGVICPACAGARIGPEGRAVTLAGTPIHRLTALCATEAAAALDALPFAPPLDRVGPPLVAEVTARLRYLERVGLGYLALDRPVDSLSGGEAQRVRLAAQIGSGLVGAGFILDEPTAGLHPRDTDRLLAILADLRDAGNSVLVVEHDETVIRAADWVIDLGPGAGPDGGQVVGQGPPTALAACETSVTGRYLDDRSRSRTDRTPAIAPRAARGWIVIRDAAEHNLRIVETRIPLGGLTCVTGVSGSGKSTLVLDILARATRRYLDGAGPRPGAHGRITGLEALDKLIVVDQAPIGRTPRSTPVTYTGVYDEIRKVFATTREAKVRGFKANRFSFNVEGGRCETCQGQGLRRIEMQFLPDLYVRCESCGGLRFNGPTLEVRYKGRSIGDVLKMRVDEALGYFDAVPQVKRGLTALHEAGLGYVTLGQPSTTLSGGEAQRVKLAAELSRPAAGQTLYILDEPTTGLHFADVENLSQVLARLADQGHTLVVIEHNLDLIRRADWVIDLGPEGGAQGGRLVAAGTPAEVAATAGSHTGAYLRAAGVGSPDSPRRMERRPRQSGRGGRAEAE